VKFLPEHNADIGRALTQDEQDRLLQVAASKSRWEPVYCAAVVAGNTTMRSVEVRHLRRRDVDLFARTVTVRRSKLKSSERLITLNAPAVKALARMIERLDALGFKEPNHYIWMRTRPTLDPTRTAVKWDTAWHSLREAANLPGLRFHDLRHTCITELAESGAPDMTIQSIAGHLSRRMLEHYSHIRIAAKRKALDDLVKQREENRQQPRADRPPETLQ
jgi:integrase